MNTKPYVLHLAAWLILLQVGSSRPTSVVIDGTAAAGVAATLSNNSRFEYAERDHRCKEEEGGGATGRQPHTKEGKVSIVLAICRHHCLLH
jgi:hypothetical protein